MQTADGCPITLIEQAGQYAGEDRGRLWIRRPQTWIWYGGFVDDAVRQAMLATAQTMSAPQCDAWFATAPGILSIHGWRPRGTEPAPG